MATEKALKSRMFTIMQYEKNPKTGEDLNFGEENILNGIEKKSIKEWAYILHDKDTWNQDAWDAYVDKNGEEPEWVVGQVKPRHWHVVLKVSPALTVNQIAKWFNVDPNFVEIKKGHNTFLDCVAYLTHESKKQQLLGKYRYADDEVKANFEFRELLDKRAEDLSKYGRDLTPKQRLRSKVLYEGMSIREVVKEYPLEYQEDFRTLDLMRAKYIAETAPLPKARMNYYIYAENGERGSGVGKGLLSKALARSMYPELERDDDIFFEVGEAPALFDGYDGQPVIIWNDRRGVQLLAELGNKVGNVYNVFDTTPTSQRQNVKYSSIKLINEVNIVNSVQSVGDFLDGLSGAQWGVTREDKNQARRRFPIIIPMRFEDFDVMINKGFMNDSNEFDQYIKYGNIRANMQRLQIAGAGHGEVVKLAEAKLLEPVVDKHNELIQRRNAREDIEVTVDDVLKNTEVKVFSEGGLVSDEKYSYKEVCSSCGMEETIVTDDAKKDGMVEYLLTCDHCRDEQPFG